MPRDKGENFAKPEHRYEPATLTVIKRPLRILLFAGAPTRDYKFCRSLFVRETEKNRAELCIYLQPIPGQIQQRTSIVQDVPPDRLLKMFPTRFGGEVKQEDKFYNLEDLRPHHRLRSRLDPAGQGATGHCQEVG